MTINYFVEGGGLIAVPQPPVGANSRYTVYVNGNAGENLPISAEVVSDVPIIVERPMYFSYGAGWTGGHDVLGFTP